MNPFVKRVLTIGGRAILVAFVIGALVLALGYGEIKKSLLRMASHKASETIGQPVEIGDFSISLPFSVTLGDITIRNPEGFQEGNLLFIRRIIVSGRLRDLIRGRLQFSWISVLSPRISLMKDEQGRLNISTGLREFLSRKGEREYAIQEAAIESGRFESADWKGAGIEKINVLLTPLSSSAGTKTMITASASLSGNTLSIEGWARLKDEPKSFALDVQATRLSAAVLGNAIGRYGVDPARTEADIFLRAEGDTEKKVRLTLQGNMRTPGRGIIRRELLDLMVEGSAVYGIAEDVLTVESVALSAGRITAASLRGSAKNLRGTPSYAAEAHIERLDLSALNLLEGLEMAGVVRSDRIVISGTLGKGLPAVSGRLDLDKGSVRSRDVHISDIEAQARFSSSPEMTGQVRFTSRLREAGKAGLRQPASMRGDLSAGWKDGEIRLSSNVGLSPLSLLLEGARKVDIGDLDVGVKGVARGRDFSGTLSIDAREVGIPGTRLEGVKAGSEVSLKGEEVLLRSPSVQSERFSASAGIVNVKMPRENGYFVFQVKDLAAKYPEHGAVVRGLSLEGSARTGKKILAGEGSFAADSAEVRGVRIADISGKAKVDGRGFSLDKLQAEVAGGGIRGSAEGRVEQGPFPVKVDLTAESLDLVPLASPFLEGLKTDYSFSGVLGRATFRGSVESAESLRGEATVEMPRLSVFRSDTKRHLLKEAAVQSTVKFQGKGASFAVGAAIGEIRASVTGTGLNLFGSDRAFRAHVTIPETGIGRIRTTFWDVFPDRLLYAGLEGSVLADLHVSTEGSEVSVSGDLGLKDFVLEGEFGEFTLGPVNGTIPVVYGKSAGGVDRLDLPEFGQAFERDRFEDMSRHFGQPFGGEGFRRIDVGSFRYGFRLLDDITLWLRKEGDFLNVGRFSATIFGGRLKGAAAMSLAGGLHYRAGMLFDGMSLTRLCDEIEPIRGYISGKVSGIGMVKGSGTDLRKAIGRADFWTYGTRQEKTKISKEFLQKLGGPSVRAYLGDRSFDKGIMSVYLQDKFFVFRELEISNRNFLGIQDLMVKVAPLSNRIAVDHLLWTIVEAAERAKKD